MLIDSQLPDDTGDFMDLYEYQDAYYQIQDEVIDSLPVDADEESFLD
ncbi:hypothetical protein [Shewanella fodinae]|uniref:Uncharacterized protein n=1 Tax=Shewanella fodinae TaxID=552357 RepID=A0A4R2FHG6_9GAMM|nr:hypothetical protein [Shewanella fodinae]TCN90291.1 hypothetical protein EDC91_102208 [Shewanella fodinae]